MENKPIGYKINQASRLFKKNVSTFAQEFGMNQTFFDILHFLMRNSEYEVTQSDICEYLHFKPSTVSITLQNMENEKLIKREKSQIDCRKTFVSLTDEGIKKCEESREVFKITEKLLESSLDSEELEKFNNYLDKIIKAMEDKLIND